jgi:hypothetical protein
MGTARWLTGKELDSRITTRGRPASQRSWTKGQVNLEAKRARKPGRTGGESSAKVRMAQEANALEQAVSRALRENLERIQRNADELHQAIADIVAACGSSKPTNALPSMLRAQTSSASLTSALEVLSRFVAMSVQSGQRSPLEAQITQLIGTAAVEPAPEPARPQPTTPTPMAHAPTPAAAPPAAPKVEAPKIAPGPPKAVPPPPVPEPEPIIELQADPETIELVETAESPVPAPIAGEELAEHFDVNQLSTEEQELHRRANRVAKVSMQDIKMLRPEQVRLGREKKDLCIRLKDDIEKAHREYDRRFKPIMDHPVDYFYRWMVEILAEGDPHALGDYPYATPARHR